MKLQQHYAYKYKSKVNYKHVLVIPNDLVARLGWLPGQELKLDVDGGKMVVSPFGKMQYDEFKSHIERILKENPSGLTWSYIREKIGFSQKVPNNKWVTRLEKDISLLRKKVMGKIIWKLGD